MQLQRSWLKRVYHVFYRFPPAMEPAETPTEDSETPTEDSESPSQTPDPERTVVPSMQVLIQPIMAATQMITVLKMCRERIDETNELMELWQDEWQMERVHQELSDAKSRVSCCIRLIQHKRNGLLDEFRHECLAHMNRFPHMLPRSDPSNYEWPVNEDS